MRIVIAALLVLCLTTSTFADGVNVRRRRVVKKVVASKPFVPTPLQPWVPQDSLLYTETELVDGTIVRPTLPLIVVPLQPEVVEVDGPWRVDEYVTPESGGSNWWLWLLPLGGLALIPLFNGDDTTPTPTTFSVPPTDLPPVVVTPFEVPPSSVPEPGSLVLLSLGLGVGIFRKWRMK